MKVKIREYQSSDEKDVKKCITELKQYESAFDEDYFTNQKSVNNLLKHILESRKKGGQLFVAEVNGQVVGFISWEIENKNDELIVKKVDSVYISDIVVLPEYRGKGIGKKLLERADEFAKEKKIPYVKLIIFSANKKVRSIYEDTGFRDYETTMIKKIS